MLWLNILLLVCSVALTAVVDAQALHVDAAAAAVRQAHDRGDFDGVVIITEHGRPVLQLALGEADRATHTPLHTNTVFRLASLTKQVTSLLVMQQVAAGALRLEQRAGDVLPTLSPTTGRVTVEQLLMHVSGLPNPSEGDGVPAFYTQRNVPANYNTATANGFCSGKPVRDPDQKFEYNNCDYIVLGALLEKVTGKPFAQLVRENVSGPLRLSSWGVFTGSGTAPVTAHAYGSDGKQDAPQNPATYGAAGALYGTALDVARWNTALLTHKLLNREQTERMFHGERNLGGEALGSWSYDLPGTTPPVHLVERQGDIGGTRLLNLLLPGEDASVVIIANTERADLFNTYSQKGLGFDTVKALTGR